jgi:hypothetical protein
VNERDRRDASSGRRLPPGRTLRRAAHRDRVDAMRCACVRERRDRAVCRDSRRCRTCQWAPGRL